MDYKFSETKTSVKGPEEVRVMMGRRKETKRREEGGGRAGGGGRVDVMWCMRAPTYSLGMSMCEWCGGRCAL